MNIYKDSQGNTCTLLELIRREPEWAANRFKSLQTDLEAARKENDIQAAMIEAMAEQTRFFGVTIAEEIQRFRELVEKRTKDCCQCEACRRDGPHLSDCAVHNAPALPTGKCSCGKEKVK